VPRAVAKQNTSAFTGVRASSALATPNGTMGDSRSRKTSVNGSAATAASRARACVLQRAASRATWALSNDRLSTKAYPEPSVAASVNASAPRRAPKTAPQVAHTTPDTTGRGRAQRTLDTTTSGRPPCSDTRDKSLSMDKKQRPMPLWPSLSDGECPACEPASAPLRAAFASCARLGQRGAYARRRPRGPGRRGRQPPRAGGQRLAAAPTDGGPRPPPPAG